MSCVGKSGEYYAACNNSVFKYWQVNSPTQVGGKDVGLEWEMRCDMVITYVNVDDAGDLYVYAREWDNTDPQEAGVIATMSQYTDPTDFNCDISRNGLYKLHPVDLGSGLWYFDIIWEHRQDYECHILLNKSWTQNTYY